MRLLGDVSVRLGYSSNYFENRDCFFSSWRATLSLYGIAEKPVDYKGEERSQL